MSDEKFTYSYSPVKNEEVDRIAAKYITVRKKADSDLERLKRLDRKAEFPGTVAGITAGLFGVLVICIGVGLVASYEYLVPGLITGITGLGIAAAATPISKAVTKRNRERYRDEILALSAKIKSGS